MIKKDYLIVPKKLIFPLFITLLTYYIFFLILIGETQDFSNSNRLILFRIGLTLSYVMFFSSFIPLIFQIIRKEYKKYIIFYTINSILAGLIYLFLILLYLPVIANKVTEL